MVNENASAIASMEKPCKNNFMSLHGMFSFRLKIVA